MSGICGIVMLDGNDASPRQLGAMLAKLEQRGPDAQRCWHSGRAALGHALLATTPEALEEQLPLTHEESRCTIIADARIDNRDELIGQLGLNGRQRMIGDGELILCSYLKWGDGCVGHLLGDFAFAIWDSRAQRLFCARDQIGMKQLIYCHLASKAFLFASEPKAVLAHVLAPRRINEGRIADFLLELEAFDLRETFFEDLFRLPPAHVLVVGQEGMTCRQYWSPQPQPELTLGSDREYAEAFLEVFSDAVRSRLRSCGPVGAMLSGGMDSGSVAAVAAAELAAWDEGPLLTFSAVGPEADTCVETRAIASALTISGIQPTLVNHAEFDEYADDLAALTKESSEPFDGQMTLVRAVYVAGRRAGVRVMLDGVAGDVIVGAGWTIANRLRRGRLIEAVREAQGEAAFWGPAWPPWKALAQAAWRAFAPRPVRTSRRELVARFRRGRRSWISSEFAGRVDVSERHRRARRLLENLDALGREERALSMVHPYLVAARERYDRVASALAIEPRDPFTDRRLINFCLSLPPGQLQEGGWPKLILRNAMEGMLPDDVRWRRGKEHLGGRFISAMLQCRPDLELTDSVLVGTIAPYVHLIQANGVRRGSKDSDRFAGWLNALYLAMWLEHVAETVRPRVPPARRGT